MTSYERRYNKDRMLLGKRLRQSARKLAEVMPLGFTDEQFYLAFPKLQPMVWKDVCELYEEYKYLNQVRSKKRKGIAHILSPKEMLKRTSAAVLHKEREARSRNSVEENILSVEYRVLEQQAQNKLVKYIDTLKKDTYFIQNITPPYVQKLITSYFDERKKNTLDVNIRYLIIQEAGKFCSVKTIRFLKQVQSGDKNEELRYAAYMVLKQMHAPHVTLHHKRDGKMTESRKRKPNPEETPEALLKNIYSAEFEKMKEFDIFISHSSQNREAIHNLMLSLNECGYVCYVDWVSDREQLKRELSSKETAEVIINRIRKSDIFVYVLTKECLNSKWSPWELGYAYALNKPICILQIIDKLDDLPEYIDLYPKFTMGEKEQMVHWIKELKNRKGK